MSKQPASRAAIATFSILLLGVFLWSILSTFGAAPATRSASAASLPLAHLVNADGTLRLDHDYVGAIDPAGWTLVLDDQGRPTFAPAPLTETGAWDGSYGAPGANMDFGGVGIYALAVDSQGRVYIGGNFEIAGNLFIDNLARWDGTAWHAVGRGANNTVRALAVDDADNLYVGGDFTQVTNGDGSVLNAGRIARWDGSTWSLLGGSDVSAGNGINGSVRAIAIDGGAVYAGGQFTFAYNATGSSVRANNVARWNGTAWSALGAGTTATGNGVSAPVHALGVGGGLVYAGGTFFTAYDDAGSAVDANRVAAWDPADGSWNALGAGAGVTGNGVNADVNALITAPNGDLYVGGSFGAAYDDVGSSVPALRLARWNGTTWSGSAVASGVNSIVNALAFNGDTLIFGGQFSALQVDGSDANAVGTFDTTTDAWGILGADQNGGSFSAPVRGNGVSAPLRALAVHAGSVFGGGEEGPFRAYNSRTSGVGIDAVARWDGAAWQALSNLQTQGANTRAPGSGGTGIRALAVDGQGNLYVGGAFSAVGNLSANRVARWDGSAWHILGGDSGDKGNGVDGIVYALAVDSGDNLYVGGDFQNAFADSTGAAISANRVVRWNGSAWTPLGADSGAVGNGVNATVFAFAVDAADGVYVGGQFTSAYNAGGDSVSANHVARWFDSGWSALGADSGATGNGVNNFVYALAMSGGELFVGGQFTTAYSDGSIPVAAGRVARWNGGAWNALGSGLNGTARALLAHGGNLYIGGEFSQAGGLDANKIARWDGGAWQALGTGSGLAGNGVNGTVHALGLSSDGLALLAGGEFTLAYDDAGSSVTAGRLAAWDLTGGGWAAFGAGLDATVYAAVPLGSSIWTGGQFTQADGAPSTYVGRWRGDALTADLALEKRAAPGTVTVGDSAVYTVTVSNAGPISSTQVVLTDTLSLAAQMVIAPAASQGTCAATANPLWVIHCDLGDLPAGVTAVVTYTIAPEVAGSLVNTALAAGQTADPDVNYNVAQATVVVEDPPTPTPSPTHTPTPTATPQPSEITLRRSVLGSAGGAGSGTGLRLNGTVGQSSPIGGTGTVSRTVGSGFWGGTLPIVRQPGGGFVDWEQVNLTFPPLPPTMTVWLIPQLGTLSNLDENAASTGISFHVEVYDQSGAPVTAFADPYEVLVSYEESQWQDAGIADEESLTLVYWDEQSESWEDTHPCTGCGLDTVNNQLLTLLNHATEFAVVGEGANGNRVFLPVTIRRP